MSGVDTKARCGRRRRRWVLAGALLPVSLALGTVLAPLPARADDAVPTNLGLLKSVTQTTLESILDSLDIRPGARVYVQPAAHHETNWLVAESLADLLRKRGARPVMLGLGVSSSPQETAPTGAQGASDDESGEPTDGEEEGISAADEDDGLGDEDQDPFGEDEDDEDQDDDGLSDEEDDDPFDGEDDGSADDDEEDGAGGQDEEADEPAGQSGTVRPQGARRQPRGESQAQDEEEAAPAPAPPPVVQPAAQDKPIEGEVLRFRVLELGVTYPGSRRSLLLMGPRSITRLAGAHLRVTRVEEPEGTVLGVADGDYHMIDRFPGSVRAYVEGAEYPFTRPEMQPGSLGKLVEPAVVLGIVAGLVFLFYANQN